MAQAGTSEKSAVVGAEGPRYAAFISYSHSDDEVADWLHRRLENYRIPKGIASPRADRRIGKVFRDRAELASSHDLGGDIRNALDQSNALILLCSPRAARSPYVQEEIRRFKETGKGERIFAVIVDGEPHAAGKPGRSAEEECFPRGLLFQVGPDGAFTTAPEPKEPIAADVRAGKDGRENGALKIVAGLLDIGLDDLVQREKRAERARRLRANTIAGAMGVLALGAVAGGAFAWLQQQEAAKQRDVAEHQTADALERLSNNIARESRALLEQGNYDQSLLMALYADPAARSTQIPDGLAPVEGYPQARARLVAAHQHNRLLHSLGDGESMSSADFSADGKLVVTSSLQGKVRIWDTQTGAPVRTLVEQKIAIFSAAFSPAPADRGRFVVTSSADRTARIWDATTSALVRTLEGHTGLVRSAAFSRNGRFVVTGSDDHTARIWDVATGQTLHILSGHRNNVFSANFSADGRFVVTGSEDGDARIWDAATGAPVRWLDGHEGRVDSAAFSTDGRFVVTASDDKTARIWDVQTGQVLHTLRGHRGIVETAAFSPGGQLVVTASMDGTARIWDAATGDTTLTLSGQAIGVQSAAFSADGRFVVTTSYDGTSRIWDVSNASPRLSVRIENSGLSTAFIPDGQLAATGTFSGTTRVWDAKTGAALRTLEGHKAAINQVAFSPVLKNGGRLIATASQDNTARVWDAVTGAFLRPLEGHTDWVNSVAFSADGRLVVTGSRDHTARIWDVGTGQTIRILKGHDDWIYSAAFSPDRRLVATGSQDGRARIWDANTGETLHILEGHTRGVTSVAFSADGRFVATASGDGTTRIWDTKTGKPVLTLEGHSGTVQSIAFSVDGRFLVSGSDDRTARIWDAATGAVLLTLEGHGNTVRSAAISADNRTVVTGSFDEMARVWTVPEMLLANAPAQVRMACEMLRQANAPLAFRVSDIANHGVLEGQTVDPDHPDLLASPCRGILPESAFDPAMATDAWARFYRSPPAPVSVSTP